MSAKDKKKFWAIQFEKMEMGKQQAKNVVIFRKILYVEK